MIHPSPPKNRRRRGPAARPDPTDPRRRSPVILPEYRLGKEPLNKGRTFTPTPLNRDEIDALFGACLERHREVDLRLGAQLAVWYRLGARLEESLWMQVDDIDLDRGVALIHHAKGDRPGRPKYRTVGVDDGAAEWIERWLDARARLEIPRSAPLFCNAFRPTRGEPMWDTSARDGVKALARRAGVTRRVHPHGFRHTHAFELRLEGWDIVDIMFQLGHARSDHTLDYINHIAPLQRIRAARGRPWEDPPATADLTKQELARVLEFVRRELDKQDLLAA